MKLPVLLAVAALAVCLTGCSHAQTDATPSATSETAEAAATATPAATPATSAEPVCAEVGTILPETADAGRSYVDETLFIGDSNTARYLLYANETGTAFTSLNNNIGVVSMGVGSITSLKCEKFKGSSAMYTVPDAVAMLKPKRIIICYGTNNLSGSSTDATNYIKTYLQGLQAIQTAWPYCDIIVSAIPPLDRQRENTNLTMTQVDAYNAALVQMCEENGFKFLNSAEVLRDDATGWAKKDYTLSDGVHLSKEAVTAYFTYVRTHAYAAEDRRPQPLGTIPTPDGVPANLINKDPIAVRGAKVPLEFVAANGGKLSGTTNQLVKKGGKAPGATAKPYVYIEPPAITKDTYEIRVNKQESCITIYKDGVPIKAMTCSPGDATPVGTFYLAGKWRWNALMGGVQGQYCSQIQGDFLFHSVLYNKTNPRTLIPSSYNNLGKRVSHGCVRLQVIDAKWIFDNCPRGTKITIYNSSDPGPLGKPALQKIPGSQTWDPTDPAI